VRLSILVVSSINQIAIDLAWVWLLLCAVSRIPGSKLDPPMHQLAIVPPIAVPMCLADAEIAAALSFAELETSEGTRRAYRSDFRIFATWCSARGLDTASTVARFLSAQATGGLKASTIGRRAAAIVFAHKLAGFEPPTSAETVRAVVRGIRHSIDTAPVRIRKNALHCTH
jgi:Phage integrase, N-terminal SAM-like domain